VDDHSLLFNAFIYLLAAVLAVPISKRLGFGAVLGYLLAGVVIGPWGLGLIREAEFCTLRNSVWCCCCLPLV